MISKFAKARNEKGFTLIELLIVIAIIGILAAIAIPQFAQYKKRAYDSDSKSNLHNLYLACKAYWADNGANNACTLALATANSYGFNQSSSVTVALGGTEDAFTGTAKHGDSSNTFSIDSNGNISMQ
ncbi:MAG: pilus assembly protein [Nitrospinae bacterium CG11_big_fil_rev_8_21_14_0_20_56_8]|nr:MAG: pilus assembly protein [Nitrospinae bacterium CG11_big_fil_rev_8_21_14_0_20_56_8]